MEQSFEHWVTTTQRTLIGYAYLLTGDGEDARDVVQEVLGAIAPRYHRVVDDGGNPTAYAKRSITNLVISRSRRNVPPTVALAVDPPVAAEAERVADRVLAWRLCAELPPRQRAAVILRFWEDLPFAQIADVLDMPESTARSHVHRALAALRERLDQEDQP